MKGGVVPPGIVIYTQVALYLHFEKSPNPQSPPIAPPQNCPILRITEADDFLLAKILILDEKSKGLGRFLDNLDAFDGKTHLFCRFSTKIRQIYLQRQKFVGSFVAQLQ